MADALRSLDIPGFSLDTVYFGGGTPALCDLRPMFDALAPLLRGADGNSRGAEFTVELHPLDVTPGLLDKLASGGVNRISLGVQSLDDDVLRDMGRGYDASYAQRAFSLVKERFDNAGIDLIAGYPRETGDVSRLYGNLASWGLRHCSVYSLQNERNLKGVPDDGFVMDRVAAMAELLGGMGLNRYEISNYAEPGRECRHNLAVWRGEDYIGLGDGACGRVGLKRTRNFAGRFPQEEIVEAQFDEKERRLFRLRTSEGLDASGHPEWERVLSGMAEDGLIKRARDVWKLTPRGMEVCDSILLELV